MQLSPCRRRPLPCRRSAADVFVFDRLLATELATPAPACRVVQAISRRRFVEPRRTSWPDTKRAWTCSCATGWARALPQGQATRTACSDVGRSRRTRRATASTCTAGSATNTSGVLALAGWRSRTRPGSHERRTCSRPPRRGHAPVPAGDRRRAAVDVCEPSRARTAAQKLRCEAVQASMREASPTSRARVHEDLARPASCSREILVPAVVFGGRALRVRLCRSRPWTMRRSVLARATRA